MKRFFVSLMVVIIVVLSTSCGVAIDHFWAPRGFTFKHTGEYNGIDTLLNIDGCFVSKEPQIYFSNGEPYELYYPFILYKDGLAYDTTTRYWGIYNLKNDTIEIQYIVYQNAIQGSISYKNKYLILSKSELEVLEAGEEKNITKQGYFSNYILQECDSSQLPSKECPWLKKKWFWKKGAKKD